MSNIKTNAMRILDKHKINYQTHCYINSGAISGVEVARALNENPDTVFKTLVTSSKSGVHYVFMVPVEAELDLKKAAQYVGEKYVEMLKQKDLLGLTGYVHGGCSPIGMKKQFKTIVHETAEQYEHIIFSAGAIGYQVELSIQELSTVIPLSLADIVV